MTMLQASSFRTLLVAAAFAVAGSAFADPLHVASSGGVAAAYKQLAPQYAKDTGQQVDSQ